MQKDIIFDGTMTWAPFVEQTVAMVRDHHNNYRMGPGYHKDEDGNVIERYTARIGAFMQQAAQSCKPPSLASP